MDRNLIDRARRGDHDAFTLLVAGTINGLYATARLILRSDDRAEDAVQDALLRAWLGLPGLHDPDRFEAWVRRLLVHACYRAARHERTRQLVEIRPLVLEGPTTPNGTRLLVNRDLLERRFRRLGPEQRAPTHRDLGSVARHLNRRPRQTLGWMKPPAALAKIVASTG